MAKPADTKDPKAKKSGGGFIPALAVITAIGGGGGWFLATKLSAPDTKGAAAEHAAEPARAADATRVIDVPPIVTNLAAPDGAFVRLQLSLVVDKAAAAALDANAFSTDIIAYLRTVPISRLSGPSGLQHLREDLQERADTRSAGQVRDIILHDLVVQ